MDKLAVGSVAMKGCAAVTLTLTLACNRGLFFFVESIRDASR